MTFRRSLGLRAVLVVAVAGLAGCSSTVHGSGEPARPGLTASPGPATSPSTSIPTSTPKPKPKPDPAEPVSCMNGVSEKCFSTPLHDLVGSLTAAGYRCGDDLGDEKCTRTGPDDPSYVFRGVPDAPRIYEMRFTVDVKNQQLPAVQARVMDGLPRLTRLAFPHTPSLATAAMNWFTAHRPGTTEGTTSETHGETLDAPYALFCHASKVGITAEGLGPRWTTTMECGISTIL